MTADTPSMHGAVATVGDFRIESSSDPSITGGESAQATLERVLAEEQAREQGDGTDNRASATMMDRPADVAPASADADTPQSATPDQGKKPPKLQVRHDELQARVHAATRDLHTARGQAEAEARRRDTLKAEADALEARLAAATSGQPAPQTATPPPTATAPAATDEPTWDGDQGYEAQGKSFQEFMRDHAAYTRRQIRDEFKAEQAAAAKTAEEARAAAEQQRLDEQRAAKIGTLVRDLAGEGAEVTTALQAAEFLDMPRTPLVTALITHHAAGKDVLRHLALNPADGYAFTDVPITEPVFHAFRETADPVRLLSALANNLPEAQRIAHLPPYQAMKALAALEESSSDAKSGSSAAASRQPRVTPLPARVGGARTVASTRPLHELGTDDFDEFARRFNAGEA